MLKRIFANKRDGQSTSFIGLPLRNLYDKLPDHQKNAFKKRISHIASGSEMVVDFGRIPDSLAKELEKMANTWLKELQMNKQSIVGVVRLQNSTVVLYIKSGFGYERLKQLRSLFLEYKATVDVNLPPSMEPMYLTIDLAPSEQFRLSSLS